MTSSLQVVYEALYGKGHPPNKENLTELSGILAGIVGRPNPWGWKYLSNIIRGADGFRVAPQMRRAIQILGNKLDGQNELQARGREITVIGVGGVEPGSVVLGDTIRCEQCYVRFVPNVPWRKYCSDECGRAARKLR